MLADQYISQGNPAKIVLTVIGIAKSTYYGRLKRRGIEPKQRGRSCSTYTSTIQGGRVTNDVVIEDIKNVLSLEFVDYGYLKVTHWLRQNRDYVISPKKVYRLMQEQGLLNKLIKRTKGKRQWVSELVPTTYQQYDTLEFDIKYEYVAGKNRNALALTIIDVETRWVLGHYRTWKIKHKDVIGLFDQLFEVYPLPKHFYVRNDNGSEFVARKVQQYFEDKKITQEFCKPATPEQNAHIESYHSIVERVVCQKYEFGSLLDLQETMNRFIKFYNNERIHSGTEYLSPYQNILNRGIDMKSIQSQKALDCKTLETLRTERLNSVA